MFQFHLFLAAHRNGFEDERIEALLHKIEIQMKHQSTNFGLSLASVSPPAFRKKIYIISDSHKRAL